MDIGEASSLESLPNWQDLTLFPLGPEGTPTAAGWADLPAGTKESLPGGLYAVRTGDGFFVVDIDCKGDKDGFHTLDMLQMPRLPDTFTVETPSGGIHLYYLGDARNGTNVLGPGIDIRGHHGYVVGPGSIKPAGTYRVIDAQPMQPAPAWLTTALATAVQVDHTPTLDAIALEEIEHAAKNRRGVYWQAIRTACKGERFIRVAGGDLGPDLGPVDDFLTRMMAALASELPTTTGAAIVRVLSPALSHLRDDDERAGNQVYTDEQIARKFDSAAAKIRANDAAVRTLVATLDQAKEKVQRTGPALLQYGRSYYLRDQDTAEYLGPYLAQEIVAQAQTLGYPVQVPTKNGTRRARPDDLMELLGDGGALAAVVYTYGTPHLDSTTRTLWVNQASLAPIDPQHDPDIAEWLGLLGGQPLLDWIRVLHDEEPVPALWFTGAPQTGKTLLVIGLSRLFSYQQPVTMARALGRFNQDLARTPLVFADEEIPKTFSGRPQIDLLKALISDPSHVIEQKYGSTSELRGCLRVIMCSNNEGMIRGSYDLTAADADALAQRVSHFHIDGERAEQIKRIFARCDVQRRWLDQGALARHLAWVIANHPEPARGPRLRLAPCSAKLRERLVTQSGAGFYVCRALYDWIVGPPEARDRVPEIIVHEGHLCVQAKGVSKLLTLDRESPSGKSIGTILARLATPVGKVYHDRKRYWQIDLANLIAWADTEGWGDPEDLMEKWQALLTRTGRSA